MYFQFSSKKYVLLAVIGAIILGIGTYLLLNNYFDRTSIVVAKEEILPGTKIEAKNIIMVQYYKNSLPPGYISDADSVIGKTAAAGREEGDPVTVQIFKKAEKDGMVEELEDGEVLMAINISSEEPLMNELKTGSRIAIISTEKDKNFYIENSGFQSDSLTISSVSTPDNKTSFPTNLNVYNLTEKIMVIDGQLIIKNIEIVEVKIDANLKEEPEIYINTKKIAGSIFIKCMINEAPVIARVIKSGEYKIFMEKI